MQKKYEPVNCVDLVHSCLSVTNITNPAVCCLYLMPNMLISSKICISFHIERAASCIRFLNRLDSFSVIVFVKSSTSSLLD